MFINNINNINNINRIISKNIILRPNNVIVKKKNQLIPYNNNKIIIQQQQQQQQRKLFGYLSKGKLQRNNTFATLNNDDIAHFKSILGTEGI